MTIKKLILFTAGIISILGLVTMLTFYIVMSANKEFIYKTYGNLPKTDAAMILGAKVESDGRLSSMLQDRTETAIELYENEKVKKILVSGDHGSKSYDEVNAVKNYLLKRNIMSEDIFLDHAGFSTYDSLYRAKSIFEIKSLTIVTQDFHLPRAIYIGRSLGISSYGISADKNTYGGIFYNYLREVPADVKASIQLALKVKPKYLGDKIPITGNGQLSWD